MRAILFALVFCYLSPICAFDSTIPVLHLPDYFDEKRRDVFLSELECAVRDSGFFAITGTGVDPSFLDAAYAQMKQFFDQDLEIKNRLKSPDGQRGYSSKESAKEEARIDFKEFFHVGRDFSLSDPRQYRSTSNLWPEAPKEFQATMRQLYHTMDHCKEVIADILSTVLGQRPKFLNKMAREGDCLLRAIHYPPNPPPNAIWAAAHTDINLFTILPKSTAQGLQILTKEGTWVDVIVPDDAFIINCGDMLENLTNGYFKSVVHRVVDSGCGQDRYSTVFFAQPRAHDRLDPLPDFIEKTGGKRLYANVNGKELLAERLIDLGRAPPELMSFFIESGAVDRLKEVGRFSQKAKRILKESGFTIN